MIIYKLDFNKPIFLEIEFGFIDDDGEYDMSDDIYHETQYFKNMDDIVSYAKKIIIDKGYIISLSRVTVYQLTSEFFGEQANCVRMLESEADDTRLLSQDMVIAISYDIKFTFNEYYTCRFEHMRYVDKNNRLYSGEMIRRETTDYLPNAGTIFKPRDIVKDITRISKEFVIDSESTLNIQKHTTLEWSNIYTGISLDKEHYITDFHESDIIKVGQMLKDEYNELINMINEGNA